jgi:hypothetical protein
MNPELDKFVRQVREKTAADTASGQKALELQTELSAYITGQTQNLMGQGVPLMEIQNALRAAVNRVEQTHTPDTDKSDEETGERLEPPISVFTFFQPFSPHDSVALYRFPAVRPAHHRQKRDYDDLYQRVFLVLCLPHRVLYL